MEVYGLKVKFNLGMPVDGGGGGGERGNYLCKYVHNKNHLRVVRLTYSESPVRPSVTKVFIVGSCCCYVKLSKSSTARDRVIDNKTI